MRRISIIGTSGCGKTTLARQLAARLNIPHIELDALHWQPHWRPAPRDLLRARVTDAIAADAWTLCGNYGGVRDLVSSRADTIIWLDYSMPTVCWRILRRTLRRCWTREPLWAGNRERFRTQLFTKDSIFLWVLTTWRHRRRRYPAELREAAGRGLRVLRFRSPGEVRRWLEGVGLV